MPAYATFEQLAARFGEKRLLGASPTSSDGTKREAWELLLLGASGEMDIYFRRQGYVLPFDFTNLPSPEAQAKLAGVCIEIALEDGGLALVATPEGAKSAADRARIWLDKVAAGVLRLPWPLESQTTFASCERPVRGLGEPLVPFDDRLFDLAATA